MPDPEKGPDHNVGPIRKSRFSIQNRHFDFHGPVFWSSSIIALVFITISLSFGSSMESIFQGVQSLISDKAGWLFILAVNIFLFFSLYIAFSRFGKIRLGGENSRPEFSTFAWFAMLFSAGMGIGILFWSVGEPITHFLNPPTGEGGTPQAAEEAMTLTYLHWGLHAWAIYAVVGLSLAFFTYNRGLPLSIRSIFQPLLGDRIHGWIGDVIDTLAVVSTLFGLATSLGFGVQQVSAGLNHLFDLPNTVSIQIILIVVITLAATISVVLGVDKGVRVLSEWNIRLAGLFLLVVVLMGPTLFVINSFVQNSGNYLQHLFEMAFWTESYSGGEWQNSWTVFYWAWWISWSPFVGTFIARVSRGRTVKEFILGVLIIPSLLTFFWLSAFGGSAIYLELGKSGEISQAVQENVATALFVMIEHFPFSFFINLLGIALVIGFFVTSSDSGSLVVDSLTSGGKLDAPKGQRIFWAQMEGLVAAVLLLGGGLAALQTAAIVAGLPFAIILLVMCVSLYKGLQKEHSAYMKSQEGLEREAYTELIRSVLQKRSQRQTASPSGTPTQSQENLKTTSNE